MPAELTRKSQPIRTRPTSKKASVALAATLSAWDNDGCDDSLVWTDMVFPLMLDRLCFPIAASITAPMEENSDSGRVAEIAYWQRHKLHRGVGPDSMGGAEPPVCL